MKQGSSNYYGIIFMYKWHMEREWNKFLLNFLLSRDYKTLSIFKFSLIPNWF